MTKPCSIILQNPVVTVIDLDGMHIQIPTTKEILNKKVILVKYENGICTPIAAKAPIVVEPQSITEQEDGIVEEKDVFNYTKKKKK